MAIKEKKEKKEISFDIYYVNRGIWLAKNVEVTVLFPFLIFLLFQNWFSFIIAIILIVVLVVLNKNGFKLEQITRFIQYFFKNNILPIDEYDYKYRKKRHLLRDGRNIPESIVDEKINLTGKRKEKNKLRS